MKRFRLFLYRLMKWICFYDVFYRDDFTVSVPREKLDVETLENLKSENFKEWNIL